MRDVEDCNRTRYDARTGLGHYESWFQRANHPERPLAFWIRYTIFSPKGRPQDAVGEVWAVWFDGETGQHLALKESVPLARCTFSSFDLDARIGVSGLNQHHLEGRLRGGGRTLRWQLDYAGDEPPLLLLRRRWYERGFPKAKALVGMPNAQFFGSVAIDGRPMRIDGWRGSQNHNWGSRHTDAYAWGQVAGFDGAPHTFLECATARLRAGGVPLPALTVAVLRVEGREYAFNGLVQALRANARLAPDVAKARLAPDGARGRLARDDAAARSTPFEWHLAARSHRARIEAHFEAPPEAFVGLAYADPPGGTHTCLNTKLARCELTFTARGEAPRRFSTRHRAAFEILTDRTDHGIAIAA
jgi:hypothetical protein